MAKIYNDISGMLLLDKPSGITSFKAVHKIKKVLKVKKTGHCGTLDPAATGLLIVLIGKATKFQDKFMKKDKVYTSSFLLGTVTNTGDLDGTIISQKDFSDINIKKIKEAAKNFTGEIYQIPPMYSALKHKGKKLYELARQGIEVERKSKKIVISEFEIISYFNGIVTVRVSCSSGTYIRTLAQDLGNFLGCGATVKALRREQIDAFDVKNALKYEDCDDANKIIENIISLSACINE
ncbi:tRNA pseudouridine(55) synthase TruB [Candidatus Endomicrobiellum devescovinae]|jgi:tRNA pseudouridine55 synthase|uniref:tRNA pseudouridine(55) synthase TruB n=1 Tax=Candidatus Endomicrobiellum devescovinae TaxID=3242322 RepID=UPI00283048FA|nr:tRNA pseudouridine(55) synthase TruB [Endomicrobium sp.]MDR1433608.1 tRNA pseudouridine(55) synthase TruB [Endomicrobium sp.]MDR2427947.1 tRNA pseudouridine(55) synthase TruB [Endomicrobium sp.]